MLSAIHDVALVESYYNEYLKLIKFYSNIKRQSIFVRYFNIDMDRSARDIDLSATYDIYNVSNIFFNVYEMTPTYYISPVVNTITSSPDLVGRQIEAGSSIVIYTLVPRENDLVMFYPPIESQEIFRVSGVRLSVNSLHSEQKLQWFEVDLEYAPVKDINNVKVLDRYVYDLSIEKYLRYENYVKKVEHLNNIKDITQQILKYYNPYFDVYCADNYIAPKVTNELIFFLKRHYSSKYNRIFEEVFTPYGYLDYVSSVISMTKLNDFVSFFSPQQIDVPSYNLSSKAGSVITWSKGDVSTSFGKLLYYTNSLCNVMMSYSNEYSS